jgi:3-hydroxyacyl-CoA dehydrogenase/enoyl-CoA hydratase/3-hydroxybutyryl-CoA epimerase
VANALYRRETYDNYPAQRAIMSCVYEGLQLPMDRALKVESRYFTWLLRQPEARAMTRSLFLSTQALGKGARRPASVPRSTVRKLGILGAGMMGAGIAYVSARAGMEVVLLDRDVASADKGKAYGVGLVDKAVARGQASEAEGRALLDRIRPTDDYAALDGCDLVIEAVFEDRAIKADVTGKAEARLAETAVFGSNTSTLPITDLAEASVRPDRFIGIHFFSPVDKMMLVELILGEQTGDEALALALDYVRAIRKTPIVVNDARGFYTSRVVSTYIDEGITMLADGIPAAMVENVGRMAGMPVGPLALNDEVSLDLARKIQLAARADLGDAYVETPRDRILEEMVDRRGRLGRKNAKGFYDYPEGAKKRLWPGLADVVPATADPDAIDIGDLDARLLVRQALETARCFEEGVVTDVREADVGAILGWGFAPFTGGPLSYIDAMGLGEFLRLCERFEQAHGSRFAPCALIRDLAASGDSFYTRFAPAGGRQEAA